LIKRKKQKREVVMQEKEIGTVTHYYGRLSVGIVELRDFLKIGDTIHIKGHTDDFTETVESMQIEHADVTEAKAGDSIGINVTQKVHPHDKVYKVIA
jgi:putative protease